jgi:geranylgeranyl transferase type-1 subunit beta
MNRVDDVLQNENWREELIQWCVHRQVGGMQGRPNKAEDTCYSYWIGGTLRLLGEDQLLDQSALREFILACQSTRMGGFGKVVGVHPDLLHSFYSMAWLSLCNERFDESERFPLNRLNCTLGVRQERAELFEGPEIP